MRRGFLLVGVLSCTTDVDISKPLEHAPLLSITAPEDGLVASEVDAIDLVGIVSDANGLDDLVILEWSSNIDGVLADIDAAPPDAAGITRFATPLTVGTHTIRLSAVDAADLAAEVSVAVVIEAAQTGPSAEITLPGPFSTFWPGEDIQLVGAANDPNQASETLMAEWSHEPAAGGIRESILATTPSPGGSVVGIWSGAEVGSHLIYLTLVDDEGNVAEAEVIIDVEDPNAGDADGDGWTVIAGDCDDTNADIHPGHAEWCDAIDNDCNLLVDDKDDDSDGHVDASCLDYDGALPVDDCDDADGTVFPGAAEQADGLDNDCNGLVDDGLSVFDNDGDCYCTAMTCTGSINSSCVVLASGDCDDTDAFLNPDDLDGDGTSTCTGDCDDTDPALSSLDLDADGWTTCTGDCDDGDASANLDDVDNDGSSSCDGDCDDGDNSLNLSDSDGDGWSTCAGDCNDASALLNLDDGDGDGTNSCDGDCDDGSALLNVDDADGDGYSSCAGDCDDGDPAVTPVDADGDGTTLCSGDCDDTDPLLNPLDVDGDGASSCDGDCNDGDDTLNLWDLDADGYSTCAGDCNDAVAADNPADVDGDGWSSCDGDCDDADAGLSLDDLDADGYSTCTGDCDDAAGSLTPADVDGDGWSSCSGDCDDLSAFLNLSDSDGDGYSTCAGDCTDADATLSPADGDGDGASTCDGDCDDADASANTTDADGDGADTCSGDCDDTDAVLNPSDLDGDGWSSCAGDCADTDVNVQPGGIEIPYNGKDDDCVGGDLVDVDGDGYDATLAGGTDCDDGSASIHPNATESCNNVDDDCDNQVDEVNASGCSTYYYDFDGDGYGTFSARCLCDPGDEAYYTAPNFNDCYDLNGDARPGQTTYFYDDRGDGSWDYNCDFVQSKNDTRTAIQSCNLCGFLDTDCCFNDGWMTGVPSCGETEDWGSGCFWIPIVSCEENSTSPVDIRCR